MPTKLCIDINIWASTLAPPTLYKYIEAVGDGGNEIA